MLSFSDWSTKKEEEVNGHSLSLISVPEESIEVARTNITAVVPDHYASPERLADILDRLGKPAVANLLRTKLPTTPTLRSGELGEIYATEYIDEHTEYRAPIKRLRWKDHRDMAMRGDDVIGICWLDGGEPIQFLKTEAKSAANVATATIEKARGALDGCDGRPSEHSLSFIADRLFELGQEELADAINLALLRDGIDLSQVQHLVFTFSGNAPDDFIRADLSNYGGPIEQLGVGLRISSHQEFIASVFSDLVGDSES